MSEPKYLTLARSYINTKEIAGTKTAPTISKWLQSLKAWWNDDETPWCGVFVGYCLGQYNHQIPKYYMRAKSWLDWGIKLDEPCVGCVVVFERTGGGHVGFVIGQDYSGRLLVLGGNQSNAVNIKPFSRDRVLGYRRPYVFWQAEGYLPTISSSDAVSVNEA